MDSQLTVSIKQAGELAYNAVVLKNKATALIGPPGIGKSDVGRQIHRKWCEQAGAEPWFFDQRDTPKPNQIGWLLTIWSQHDITDLKFPAVMDHKMVFHYSTELPLEGNEDRFPRRGLWNMGEVTNVEAYMQKALMQIILERRLGTRRVLPGWKILADGNRAADRSYTVPMAPPLANRILWLNVATSVDDWIFWAHHNNIRPEIIAFVRFRPNLLHKFDPITYSAGELAFPTPRQWTSANDLIDLAPEIRVPLISGLVGQAAGLEYEGFVRVWGNLPDMEVIEATGKGKIPRDQATLLAVVSSLVVRVKEENIGNIFDYVGGLPGEHQMLFVKDLINKNPMYATHKDYSRWASTHGKNIF
jgi:hypothetical protein